MRGIGLFGRLYWNTARHYVVPARWATYFPFISLTSLGIALLALEFIGFKRVFNYLNGLEDFTLFFVQFLLERLVGLIFLISYSMIFMSSMINGLSTFFLSASLPFLHTLPIPRWKVLIVKFIENWIVSCYLVVGFLACFLGSYVYSFHLGWTQYLICAGLLMLFTLSPVALGSAMVTMLIRFFPVRRIHQLVTIFGGIFLAALVIAVRIMKPEVLLNPRATDDYGQLIKDMTLPSMNHLPSTWAAKVVIFGDGADLLKLALFTFAALSIMALVLHAVYERAFVFSQESRTVRGVPSGRRRRRPKHGIVVSLIRKDLKIFMRDATQWSQLLLLAALVVVYLVNIRNLGVQMPGVKWIVSFLNLGLAGFVLAALSVRFLFPSVSAEGRAFWIVRTMPVSFRTLLWCKYIIYFPPFLVFTQLLVFFSNRILEVPVFFMVLSSLNILAVSFALTGLAIGIGALMPNFKAENPSQIAVGPGGVLYMLISFIYLALMLLLQIRPVWFYLIQRSDEINNVVYAVAAFCLTMLLALLPMELGARRLATREHF